MVGHDKFVTTIDIKARFIDDKAKVYILFPGPGYRYFNTMEQEEAVFLDIPGFPIFQTGDVPQRSDIIKSIVVSDRVRDWHSHNRPLDKEPERRLDYVKDYNVTQWRQQFGAMVENFFNNIKLGDIIIVPGPKEESNVLFGEIIDAPGSSFAVQAPFYDDEYIPARKVRWIQRIQRRGLPRWLDNKIPNQNPLRQIERSQYQYIFDLMYERYYYDKRFAVKMRTESREFSALDSYLLNQVVLYITALHESLHDGHIKDIDKRSMSDVVSSIVFSSDIPEQRVIIQSPGFIVLDAKNVIPMVAGVFMAMSAATAGAGELPAPQIVNTSDQSQLSQQCVADIQDEVDKDIEMMGYRRWQELCRAELQARERTKLNSGMSAHRR